MYYASSVTNLFIERNLWDVTILRSSLTIVLVANKNFNEQLPRNTLSWWETLDEKLQIDFILFYLFTFMHSSANNVRHSLATHALQYSDPSKFVTKINLISLVDWNWFIFSIIFFIYFYPKTNLI